MKPWRPSWSGILWFSFERAPGSDHLVQRVPGTAGISKCCVLKVEDLNSYHIILATQENLNKKEDENLAGG